MKNVVLVYDDSVKPSAEICDINGGRSFGSTIYKRKRLYEIFSDKVKEVIPEAGNVMWYRDGELKIPSGVTVIIVNSAFIVASSSELLTLIKKASYAKENYVIKNHASGMRSAFIFEGVDALNDAAIKSQGNLWKREYECGFLEIEDKAFSYLGSQREFVSFLTGGFDARFFNSLDGDYYTVTKSSSNIEKIKKEYQFYYLLPENMKHWFVQPYDYKEDENRASYTMERLHMTDVALRYVHGAISDGEMCEILDQCFEFIDKRAVKEASISELESVCKKLYIDKVEERISMLEAHPGYAKIAGVISCMTKYANIRELFERYKELYLDAMAQHIRELERKASGKAYLAVGHGDLCFSNILFQKDAHILRLIDPKGALCEADIFTDPLYDIAKLSHSICGKYDFFNAGLFELSVGKDMELKLSVDSKVTSDAEVLEFKRRLEERGYSYRLIRLLEASLFISMLPLHMDNEQKVLGFIINAINILELC